MSLNGCRFLLLQSTEGLQNGFLGQVFGLGSLDYTGCNRNVVYLQPNDVLRDEMVFYLAINAKGRRFHRTLLAHFEGAQAFCLPDSGKPPSLNLGYNDFGKHVRFVGVLHFPDLSFRATNLFTHE